MQRKIRARSLASSPLVLPFPIPAATSCRKPSLNQVPELAAGVGKLLVFGIIVAIGMSLGGLTGYALNPARDLGPRIAHAILPIKGKGSSNFKYGLIVPIFGPIIGGLLAVLLYNVIPWAAV